MSYQVLARKWRPRFFREMVGQEHVLQALINALDHGRLHHAYLFTGTRGVGKTTIARILAKCLNCETGISSEPCGQCSACREINDGCFVDLIEVDAASRTKVEDTRELLDNVQYAPSKGRFKVYLIDEVHMLSTHSFNALLKTLEEPPEHVKFLLATTDPQKLPATILSRCLQFHLKNMAPERIVQHLQHVLQQEMVEFEEPALWALARSAEGSMRDAMSLTDQAIAFGSGKVLETEVRAMLGSIDQQTVYLLAQALVQHNAAGLLQVIADFSEQAPDYTGVMDELLLLLHRMTIAQMVPDAIDNSLGDRERVLELAQQVTAEELQLFYQMGLLGKRDLPLAPDLRTGLEMAVLRMLTFRPQGLAEPPGKALPQATVSASAAEAVAAVKKPEAVSRAPAAEQPVTAAIPAVPEPEPEPPPLAAEPVAVVEPQPVVAPRPVQPQPAVPAEAPKPQVSITNHQQWLEQFAELPFSGLLRSVAAECVLITVEPGKWTFAINRDHAQLFNERHPQQIADVLNTVLAEPVSVVVEAVASDRMTPAQYMAQQRQQAYDAALAEIQADDGVQALLQEYDGQIVLESVTARDREKES